MELPFSFSPGLLKKVFQVSLQLVFYDTSLNLALEQWLLSTSDSQVPAENFSRYNNTSDFNPTL
jgi:hypothetical protein